MKTGGLAPERLSVDRHPGLERGSRYLAPRLEEEAGPRIKSGATKVGWLKLIGLLALLAPTVAAADTLYDHANGVALDAAGKVVRFTGLLVGDDGKVKRLLTAAARRPAAARVDLHGATLMPGFVDAHGHVMDLGYRAVTIDLSDTTSLAQAQAVIAAYVRAHPGTGWIQGSGWNQEKWHLGRFPTAAELDRVTGGRPAWIDRIDGHAAWANTAAMTAAGVTAATPVPSGGQISHVGDNQPGGVFIDNARILVEHAVPPPTPAQNDAAFAAAQALLLSHGITAIGDMRTLPADWATYQRAGAAGRLGLRIMCYANGMPAARAAVRGKPTGWLFGDHLKMGGIKFFADGALGSRGAWLKAPYADAPGLRGTPFHSDAELLASMREAAGAGFQIAAHAIGDAANAQVLSAYEALADQFPGDRRWRVEHAQIVDVADLPRFGRHGIIASMQPVHATSDRLMAEARLGPDRLGGAYAWASMLKVGAPLAFGSDVPNDVFNPFVGWASAFTRQDAADQPPGGWLPDQRVSRVAAWRAYSWGGAYAAFAETRFGTLAPGMAADFILVDRDPLTATPDALRASVVQAVWVGGRKVWSR